MEANAPLLTVYPGVSWWSVCRDEGTALVLTDAELAACCVMLVLTDTTVPFSLTPSVYPHHDAFSEDFGGATCGQ